MLCTTQLICSVVHYTLCTTHCALHNVHYTLCTSHCALHTVHYTLCTAFCRMGKSKSVHFCISPLPRSCTYFQGPRGTLLRCTVIKCKLLCILELWSIVWCTSRCICCTMCITLACKNTVQFSTLSAAVQRRVCFTMLCSHFNSAIVAFTISVQTCTACASTLNSLCSVHFKVPFALQCSVVLSSVQLY